MIYPGIKLLLRALALPEARELSSRFLPRRSPIIPRSVAGCSASNRCRASSAPIRRTGVTPLSDKNWPDTALGGNTG